MDNCYLISQIGKIEKGILSMIDCGVINPEQKVLLYGLDRYAFAMRTVLSNLGYHNIEGYISDDTAAVVEHNKIIKDFACRYLNSDANIIQVSTIEERLKPFDESVLILIASKDYEQEKEKLSTLGYRESVHFHKVADFVDQEIDSLFLGKRRMSLKEIHETEKEILFYVDKLCLEHGLRYWVCGGTLLGTIRHKGFIPWDDDIDIFLPWEDYKKFIEIFEENERFGLLGMGAKDGNFFSDPFAKVVDKRAIVDEDIGTVRKINPIWIDIFPLVGLPTDDKERHLFFTHYQELNRQIWEEFYATNGKIEGLSKWYERQKEFLERYDFDDSQYVGVLGTAYGERDCTNRDVYHSTLRMPFEDIEVNVPTGYEEYLVNLYGKDWGILPEESKRKSHHNISMYWV